MVARNRHETPSTRSAENRPAYVTRSRQPVRYKTDDAPRSAVPSRPDTPGLIAVVVWFAVLVLTAAAVDLAVVLLAVRCALTGMPDRSGG